MTGDIVMGAGAVRPAPALVGTVGHVAIFYRPARQRERRRIELPR